MKLPRFQFSLAGLLLSTGCMAGSAAALALIVDPACKGAFDGWLFGFYTIAFGAVVSSICAGAAVGVLVRSKSVGVICAVLAFAALYVLIPMIWA